MVVRAAIPGTRFFRPGIVRPGISSRAAAWTQAPPDDTTGLVDGLVFTLTHVIAPDDSTGLVDSEFETVSKVITPDDPTGLVDNESEVVSKVITPDDPTGLVDPAPTTFRAALLTFDDLGTASADGSPSTTTIYVRTIAPDDSRGLLDTPATASAFVRVISPDDARGLLDSVADAESYQVVRNDLVGLVDSESAFRGVPGTLPPDAILLETGATGVVADINEDPASPDANWLSGTAALDLHVSFGSPGGTLAPGTNIQTFRILARQH